MLHTGWLTETSGLWFPSSMAAVYTYQSIPDTMHSIEAGRGVHR